MKNRFACAQYTDEHAHILGDVSTPCAEVGRAALMRKSERYTRARIDAIVRDWRRSGWLLAWGERTGMRPSAALRALDENDKGTPALQAAK